MASQFVFLKRLRSGEKEIIDLFRNEQDGWYRLRKIKASIDSADAEVKIISLSPDEMREALSCVPVVPSFNPLLQQELPNSHIEIELTATGRVGSGKGTILTFIAEALEQKGCSVTTTRENSIRIFISKK